MKPNRSVKQYAFALWSVAEQVHAIDDVKTSLQTLSGLYQSESVFKAFLKTSRIETEDKVKILINIFNNQCHVTVLELYRLLDQAKQGHLIIDIANEYIRLEKEKLNLISVKVYTPEVLDDKDTQWIRDSLEKSTGNKVEFSSEADSSLLGGIKMRIGNTYIDGTVASQMEKLRRNLISEW